MPELSYDTKIVLRPDSEPADVAAAINAELARTGRVTVMIRVGEDLPDAVIGAAVEATSSSSEANLYVLGYRGDPDPATLTRFRSVQRLNLNVRSSTRFEFLSEFTALRSLTIQSSPARKLPLTFLAGMPRLTRLAIGASVRKTDALASCTELESLHCSATAGVLAALAGHPALRYLDVGFGSHRDLGVLATIPTLCGVAVHRIVGLDGHDLEPLGACASLGALSLSSLKHVTHLEALTGHATLRALLLENLPNLQNLHGLAGCDKLQQLGLYESRPQDRSLEPLRELARLAHLVLGDPYPPHEIEQLRAWYQGSLRYRGTGPEEFKPRWRTPIEILDSGD